MTEKRRKSGPPRKVPMEEAFAYWYHEGAYRTHAAVAEHFGVTVRTVERWASDDDWNASATKLDMEARRVAERELARQAANRIKAQLGAADLILRTFIEGVRNGRITVSTSDALAWGKHAHLLTGGVTERSETVQADERQARIAEAVAEELGGLTVEQLEAEEGIDP